MNKTYKQGIAVGVVLALVVASAAYLVTQNTTEGQDSSGGGGGKYEPPHESTVIFWPLQLNATKTGNTITLSTNLTSPNYLAFWVTIVNVDDNRIDRRLIAIGEDYPFYGNEYSYTVNETPVRVVIEKTNVNSGIDIHIRTF